MNETTSEEYGKLMTSEEYDQLIEFAKQEALNDEEVKYTHALVETKVMELRMSAKITSLDFANRFASTPDQPATADAVVARAQTYYDFLIAPDPEDNEIPEEN